MREAQGPTAPAMGDPNAMTKGLPWIQTPKGMVVELVHQHGVEGAQGLQQLGMMAIEQGHDVWLDWSQLRYLDACLLQTVISLGTTLQRHGQRLHTSYGSLAVSESLELTGAAGRFAPESFVAETFVAETVVAETIVSDPPAAPKRRKKKQKPQEQPAAELPNPTEHSLAAGAQE